MLVLSRKVGEKVLIGADVKITVLEMRDGQVKLGFDAPAHVGIARVEGDGIRVSRSEDRSMNARFEKDRA